MHRENPLPQHIHSAIGRRESFSREEYYEDVMVILGYHSHLITWRTLKAKYREYRDSYYDCCCSRS